MAPHAASLADSQLPQGSPALQLLWQPVASLPVSAPAAPAPQKWLILSSQPCSLAQLCSSIEAPVTALNVIFGKADNAAGDRGAEVSAGSEEELRLVLEGTPADHVLLVQDARVPIGQPGMGTVALLWAFRAFQRCRTRARLSLVTWGTQDVGPYDAAAEPACHMALGVPALHS
jgi:hypothetical protein